MSVTGTSYRVQSTAQRNYYPAGTMASRFPLSATCYAAAICTGVFLGTGTKNLRITTLKAQRGGSASQRSSPNSGSSPAEVRRVFKQTAVVCETAQF